MRKTRTNEGLLQYLEATWFSEKIWDFILKVPLFAQNRQKLFAHDIK